MTFWLFLFYILFPNNLVANIVFPGKQGGGGGGQTAAGNQASGRRETTKTKFLSESHHKTSHCPLGTNRFMLRIHMAYVLNSYCLRYWYSALSYQANWELVTLFSLGSAKKHLEIIYFHRRMLLNLRFWFTFHSHLPLSWRPWAQRKRFTWKPRSIDQMPKLIQLTQNFGILLENIYPLICSLQWYPQQAILASLVVFMGWVKLVLLWSENMTVLLLGFSLEKWGDRLNSVTLAPHVINGRFFFKTENPCIFIAMLSPLYTVAIPCSTNTFNQETIGSRYVLQSLTLLSRRAKA